MNEFLTKLVGFLGSDAGKGLLNTGAGVLGAINQMDALNFQKNMAKKSFNMQQETFDINKEKEERTRNLDFAAGMQ